MHGFGHNLRVVTLLHVAVVGALCFMSGCRWLFRKKPETVIPIEFTVAVPAASAPEPVATPAPAPPPEVPRPAPTPKPTPKPPQPKPPSPRRKIETSRKRVRRGAENEPTPSLSAEEIERLLAQGARPSDRTQIPDADARGFARVRSAFYDVWVQPSRAAVGDDTVEALIVLGSNGRVITRRLLRPSGNAVLDNSVQRALNAVMQVSGLPSGFETRHREITIAFRVE